MHLLSRRKNRRIGGRLLVVGLLAIVAAAALFVHAQRTAVTTAPRAAANAGERAYANRALTPRRGRAPSAAADRPTITGYVYGMDGAPVAGASIVATTFEIAGNLPSRAGIALSDDLGRFVITVADGTYQLNASMNGYGPAQLIAHTGETASLFLPRSGIVVGHVHDEEGQPIKSFSVDVVTATGVDMPAPPPLASKRFESPDGSFRLEELPARSVVLRASADGFAPAFSPPLTTAEGETRELDLTLVKGCELTGHVVTPAGAPVSGVVVDAEARFYAGSMSELSMQAAEQSKSDERGLFRLENVPKGAVLVRGYDGTSAVAMVDLDITECERIEPVKLVMTSGGSVIGAARLGDGKPLPGARLTLMHRSIGFVNAVSDDEGRFRFDRIPAGPARLELHQDGQIALELVDVAEGRETAVDVTLPAKGSGELRGRVTAGGKPLAGARLLVAANRGAGESGLGVYHPVTAEDGTYSVSSLPEGAYLLNVMSTKTSRGVKIKRDATSTIDLDVTTKRRIARRADEPVDD